MRNNVDLCMQVVHCCPVSQHIVFWLTVHSMLLRSSSGALGEVLVCSCSAIAVNHEQHLCFALQACHNVYAHTLSVTFCAVLVLLHCSGTATCRPWRCDWMVKLLAPCSHCRSDLPQDRPGHSASWVHGSWHACAQCMFFLLKVCVHGVDR